MATQMPSSLEIAQEAELRPIAQIAEALGLSEDEYDPYGRYKAKVVALRARTPRATSPTAKLIDVTAITPTKAGEGKTTTSVSLTQGLGHIGKNPVLCLREASLGPVFGIKGGAAGGGYAQVVPMEDMNLHFTGDIHAIGAANNLLAALLEAHMLHGNKLGIDPLSITWRRCVDINDRALRNDRRRASAAARTATSARPASTSRRRPRSWRIVAVARDLFDLRERLGQDHRRLHAGRASRSRPSSSRLRARWPSYSRTRSSRTSCRRSRASPRSSHCGPFANIAHGNNSLVATRTALKLGDYTVTESGFGSDMGMEKFFDIVCRVGELRPNAVVLVATAAGAQAPRRRPRRRRRRDRARRGQHAAPPRDREGVRPERRRRRSTASRATRTTRSRRVKRLALEGGAHGRGAERGVRARRRGRGGARGSRRRSCGGSLRLQARLRARPADRGEDRGNLQARLRSAKASSSSPPRSRRSSATRRSASTSSPSAWRRRTSRSPTTPRC